MYQPIRGTRDLLGDEYLRHLKIVETARNLATHYGYNAIETPIFESTGVFQKSLGETSDVVGKEMYTFLDRGGDSITLRPEGTAAVVRAFLTAGLSQTLPQKFFYYGPMFRYERPQKGRYRQFYQIGVECLGWDDPHSDVDCIALAHHLLSSLGIETSLSLNTLGAEEDRIRYRQALIDYLTPYKNDLSLDSQNRLESNPLRILDSKNETDQKICKEAPRMILGSESQYFFESVCAGLDALSIPFNHDLTLVRGLDYYVHTAFEFRSKSLGAQDTVLGGGRYNNLVAQMGGPQVSGIGWAMGVERASLSAPESLFQRDETCIAVIPVEDLQKNPSLLLAKKLREKGLKVEVITAYNDLGKRLKAASRLKAKWVVIIGSDEIAKQEVQIKYFGEDKNTPKNQMIKWDNIFNFFIESV